MSHSSSDCRLIPPLNTSTSQLHSWASHHLYLQQIPTPCHCSAEAMANPLHSVQNLLLLEWVSLPSRVSRFSPRSPVLQCPSAGLFREGWQALCPCISCNFKWRSTAERRKDRKNPASSHWLQICLHNIFPVLPSVKYSSGLQKDSQEWRRWDSLWPRNCYSHYCIACKKALYTLKKDIHSVLGENVMRKESISAFTRVSVLEETWWHFLVLEEPWWHQPSDCVEGNWVLTAQICLSLVVILDSFPFVVSPITEIVADWLLHTSTLPSQRIRDSTQNFQEPTSLSLYSICFIQTF